jgi:hypothetical protein
VKKARGGKWSGVDECYLRPPLSTHEILHPEEYLSGRTQLYSIELPSWGKNRWIPLWNSSLGEFGIRFVLRSTRSGGSLRTVLNPVDADRIAEGIRGDRYQVFEESPAGKTPMLVWVTIWQDQKSARAFFDTYAKILGWKYPSARVPKEGDAEDSYRLTGDGRTSFVTRRDKLILIGENLPEAASEDIEERLSKSVLGPLSRPDPHSKGVYVFECSSHPDGTVAPFPVDCRRCGARPTRKDKP